MRAKAKRMDVVLNSAIGPLCHLFCVKRTKRDALP